MLDTQPGMLSVLAAPPPSFLPAIEPYNVSLKQFRPGAVAHRRSGAQKAGLAYEQRAKHWLAEQCPDAQEIIFGPWYCFEDFGREQHRYCQPDAEVFENTGTVTIVEVKLRWCSEAWWQLRRLYLPVIQAYLAPKVPPFRLVCVCRSFDPDVKVPEPVTLLPSWRQVASLRSGRFGPDAPQVGVVVWKP